DDEAVVNLSRLFNEPEGHKYLVKKGVPQQVIDQLDLLGFSSIANILSSIKFAKYNELTETDIVFTVFTDSMELYGSRIKEMHNDMGPFTEVDAAAAYAQYLQGVTSDNLLELTYESRKRVHNLKYFTWVEQQGKTYQEIQDQWYAPDYWTDVQDQVGKVDELIAEFNDRVGISK
ncbi:MAG: pyridoxal-5-phosphate-dependent protein subunit beta, partial [Anaerolineaceae bacterium]|nr:pyridoxal-5-phosphate-dependent protein subunit beta [Anaerolineaceae bacterium]